MARCYCAPVVRAAVESSAPNQRGQSWASTSFFDQAGGHSFPSSRSAQFSSEHRRIQPDRLPRAASLHVLRSPRAQSSPRTGVSSSLQHELDTLSCCRRTQWASGGSSNRPCEKYMLGAWRPGLCGRAGWETDARPGNQWRRGREILCEASGGATVGSLYWMSKATPYEVLGVGLDSSEEDIKSAFRARIKEYHPDVYQGLGDADAITQRLLRAYELLTSSNVERATFQRKSVDPFEEPECVAADVFVNELGCIGRGCSYSCVERAPDVFQFASDTGRARAVNQDAVSRKAGQYHVQLAVGQCPTNCIHCLTPEQRLRLEEILKSVLEGTVYSSEVVVMEGLIARANFENGRFRSPKRKAKKSEKWVDWY